MSEEKKETPIEEENNSSANETIDENDKKLKEGDKKDRSRLKYLINIIVVSIVTVVALIISLSSNVNEIFSMLAGADWARLALMLGVMFISVLVRALIGFFFARLYTRDYHFHQALAVEEIGVFYSAVTPGATGGEIMEAYMYKKQGIKISNAVSMMAMCSIIYQVVLIVYGIVSFILKYNVLMDIQFVTITLGAVELKLSIWLLTIIGFVLNLSVILIVFLMSYWRGFHNFIMGPCVRLGYKLHIVHDVDKTRENLKVQVENFKIELRRLLLNFRFTILIAVLFFVFLTLRFSLPYFAGLALHNESTYANFWDAVLLSNYHQMVTGLIPIPGSAGISEYFFGQLFINASNPELGFYYISASTTAEALTKSNALCMAALLLWRTVSFTLPLLIAGIVTAFYRVRPVDIEKDNKEIPSRQTYLHTVSETLFNRQEEVDELVHTNVLTREAIMKKLKLDRMKQKNQTKQNKNIKNKKSKSNQEEKYFEEIDITKDDD